MQVKPVSSKIMVALLFILGVSLLTASPVDAQEGQPGGPVNQSEYPTDDQVNGIAKNLYCPVCPNTPLDVCETKACEDWRAQIREQLAAGWNEQQVIDYFVTQYGERVLAEPQRKGFTSMVWLLPVIAVLVGAGIVLQVITSWRKQPALPVASAAPAPQVSHELLARIEKELQEID